MNGTLPRTTALLFPSSLFMNVARGIAFFDYCIAVPANRLGHRDYSAGQLKAALSPLTFVIISHAPPGRPVTPRTAFGMSLILAGVWTAF